MLVFNPSPSFARANNKRIFPCLCCRWDIRIELNCVFVCKWSVFWMVSHVWLHFESSPSLQMLLISSPSFDDVPGECKCVCCHQNKNILSLVLIRYSDLSWLALRWLSSCSNWRMVEVMDIKNGTIHHFPCLKLFSSSLPCLLIFQVNNSRWWMLIWNKNDGMIQQSTGYHERNRNELGSHKRNELGLQSLSGGFCLHLRNQNLLDRPNMMQSQYDTTINPREGRINNSTINPWNRKVRNR